MAQFETLMSSAFFERRQFLFRFVEVAEIGFTAVEQRLLRMHDEIVSAVYGVCAVKKHHYRRETHHRFSHRTLRENTGEHSQRKKSRNSTQPENHHHECPPESTTRTRRRHRKEIDKTAGQQTVQQTQYIETVE